RPSRWGTWRARRRASGLRATGYWPLLVAGYPLTSLPAVKRASAARRSHPDPAQSNLQSYRPLPSSGTRKSVCVEAPAGSKRVLQAALSPMTLMTEVVTHTEFPPTFATAQAMESPATTKRGGVVSGLLELGAETQVTPESRTLCAATPVTAESKTAMSP